MSEQNQMAISPVTAGLTGAAIGGIGNYFLGVGAAPKKGFKDTKELLTLEPDKFEELKKKIDASSNEEAKTEFKKLEDGRKIVSSAGDTLEKEQAAARKEMNAAIEKDLEANLTGDAKTTFTNAVKTEKDALTKAQNDYATVGQERKKAGTELAKAREDYKNKLTTKYNAIVNDKADGTLGKQLADLEASKAGKTGDELAKIEKDIKAKKAEIHAKALEDADVKAAADKLKTERKAVTTANKAKIEAVPTAQEAYNKKFGESADEALKDVKANKDGSALEKLKALVEEKKAILAKKVEDAKNAEVEKLVGENGSLKDLDTGKFKKFLPKAKTWPIVIAAAALGLAGVALAYMVGPKNATPADVA